MLRERSPEPDVGRHQPNLLPQRGDGAGGEDGALVMVRAEAVLRRVVAAEAEWCASSG